MSSMQHVGDLGNIVAGQDGRASFRLEDSQLKVTHTRTHIRTHGHTYTAIVCIESRAGGYSIFSFNLFWEAKMSHVDI